MRRGRRLYQEPVPPRDPNRACPCDPFGDLRPRPIGTIARITGRIEPEVTLRRILRACYRDWLSYGQANAHHMTKRLYEQLTGRLDEEAAMRTALHRDFDGHSVQAKEIGFGPEDDRRNRWDFDCDA